MNIYSTEAFEPLRFFSCGNLFSKDGFIHQRRTLNCNVLIYVQEGKLYINRAGTEYAVSKGEYILLKGDEEHFGYKASQGKLSYLWVHFKTEEPLEASETLPGKYAYAIPEYYGSASDQRIALLFHQLIDLSRREKLYTEKMLSCALSMLLMEITREYAEFCSGSKDISPVILNVMEWIKSNCHRQLSISDIAEEFHYNVEYISALFKKETGVTMVKYLNRSRIEISKNLLSSENVSIKEAAYSSGFNDEKYYMKIFKQFEGITPLQYKNNVSSSL